MDKFQAEPIDKPLRKSLMELTMRFEEAWNEHDYDSCADILTCIKSKIKSKAIAAGEKNKNSVMRVEMLLAWYWQKDERYQRIFPDGSRGIVFPKDMEKRIKKNLTAAYERLVQQMDKLELI